MGSPDQNKAAAVKFLQLASSGRVNEAYETYVAPDFKHHNPWYPAGAAALKAGMEENMKLNPGKTLEVKHALGEGDLVAVHSSVRMKADEPPAAVVHVFKFRADRIVELWDVGMAAPDESTNSDGLF
jgi:predicted SnoaL-like aldol condensation-catalyzing enzyme